MKILKFYSTEPLLKDREFIIYFYKMSKEEGKKSIKIINELTENFCYDRDFCKEHNIDYCNITGKDILNIKRYIIRTLKKYDSI
ncbi:MAG: hypothetical protein QXK80_00140 [Candidatus Pacearchaeota archaeon]